MLKQPHTDEFHPEIFRLAGYGFLIFAILDIATILLPVRGLNAPWIFQSIGAIVERIPLPLLALLLIFSGGRELRSSWERKLVRFLSHLSLVTGILFLALIPILLSVTVRFYGQVTAQVNLQSSQQLTQLQRVEQRIGQATTQDLTRFLQSLEQQGTLPDTITDPQALRTQLLTNVQQATQAAKTQATTTRKDQQTTILKNAMKWSLGSLLSGGLFISFWWYTGWTRRKRSTKVRVVTPV